MILNMMLNIDFFSSYCIEVRNSSTLTTLVCRYTCAASHCYTSLKTWYLQTSLISAWWQCICQLIKQVVYKASVSVIPWVDCWVLFLLTIAWQNAIETWNMAVDASCNLISSFDTIYNNNDTIILIQYYYSTSAVPMTHWTCAPIHCWQQHGIQELWLVQSGSRSLKVPFLERSGLVERCWRAEEQSRTWHPSFSQDFGLLKNVFRKVCFNILPFFVKSLSLCWLYRLPDAVFRPNTAQIIRAARLLTKSMMQLNASLQELLWREVSYKVRLPGKFWRYVWAQHSTSWLLSIQTPFGEQAF